MKYFKHDSDAAQDAKLRRLRLKYGMEGYGVYWFILELIARNVDKHNLTFELEHDAELIAADAGIHYERVEDMMRYMVELGLFENVNGIIRCLKMASRTDEYTQKLLHSARPAAVVPTLSRQTPDTVGTKSVLREEKRTEEKRTEQKERLLKESPAPSARTPHQEIIEIYHRELPELPNVVALNESRRKQIRTHHTGIMESDIANWRGYFQAVRRSDFLMGRKKDWRADFDFLLRTKTPLKVLEGSYS